MKGDNDGLTRRRFLEHAGVAIGAAAIGAGCGSDDEANTPGGASGASGAGASGGAGGAGAAGGEGGAGGAGAAGGEGGAGGAGAAGGAGGAGASGGAGAAGGAGGAPPDGGNPTDVRVAIVHRDNIDEAVAKAVELAGGLGAIQPGQTVFIKPNVVNNRALGTPGIRTSPEVVAAVVRLVKTRNPGRIIVGDRSARTFPDTQLNFEQTGLRDAALGAGADEIYAGRSPADAPDEWVMVQPPHYEETWAGAGGLLAMKRILDADHLINVPTCKDHRYALYSMSMKNFVGAIGDPMRGNLHFGNFASIGRDIAIFNQIYNPMMNILDATTALINGGPEGDGAQAVRTSPGLVCASTNRAALDALGVSLIKLELTRTTVSQPDPANATLRQERPFGMPQIVNAGMLGIGVAGPEAVTLLFDAASDAAELERIYRS